MNLEKTLQEIFGYSSFKAGQKESIQALLNQKDVLCILPTSGGKSLIYQLTSILYETGITLVISPLIALMKEQTEYLKSLGISAEYCFSEQDELEQKLILSRTVTQKLKVLFLSPEKASSSFFRSLFLKIKINLLVIDEAHCISEWGHDFRPEYRKIHELREIAKYKFPVLALTATATEKVRKDIITSLKLKSPFVYIASFFRSNLIFEVCYMTSKSEKQKRLLRILKELNLNKKVIIYCATRKETEELEKILQKSKISVLAYHAGKSTIERGRIQNSFVKNHAFVLVTTNAFGLGINISDIQAVIHYNVPSSLEAYYQEAGRAGRDGNLSKCILFCCEKDFSVQKRIRSLSKNKQLIEEMRRYATNWECRQVFLCRYFGENIQPCGICDVCTNKSANEFFDYIQNIQARKEKINSKLQNLNEREIEILTQCIQSFSGKFGKKIMIGILRGSKTKEILKKNLNLSPFYGKLSHFNEASLNRAIENLVQEKRLTVKGKKFPKLAVVTTKIKSKDKSRQNTNTLFLKLKSFRDQTAKKYGWKKFMVLHNSVLKMISEQKPKNSEELLQIKGLGNEKVAKFGEDILNIVQRFYD